ncbi:MAG TPA: hypothetical protein VFT74_12700 [Isosphaeraceae bacterium]|nr:hypothetical protein [Isosphaeraceae bacterium]
MSDILEQPAAAIYEETQPHLSRRFALYENVVRVTGSSLSGDGDQTIALGQLDPQFARSWVYSFYFHVSYAVCLLGMTAFLGVGVAMEFPDARTLPTKPLELTGGIAVIGLVLALVNRRKIEFVVFRSDAGVPMLTVGRVGRSADEFDLFVASLVERIHRARECVR